MTKRKLSHNLITVEATNVLWFRLFDTQSIASKGIKVTSGSSELKFQVDEARNYCVIVHRRIKIFMSREERVMDGR